MTAPLANGCVKFLWARWHLYRRVGKGRSQRSRRSWAIKPWQVWRHWLALADHAVGALVEIQFVRSIKLGTFYAMPFGLLLAAAAATNSVANANADVVRGPSFGLMFWVLMFVSAVAIVVVIERVLFFHRVSIDSAQFLAGVRNVIRRDNVIEALSICDATPGPVSRLVKAALLNRDGGRARVDEVIEEIGQTEVPRLEHNLPFLATLAQVSPLLGLMGTLFGFAAVFRELRHPDGLGVGYAAPGQMFDGMMQSLYTAALGIGIAVFCYAAYNYLVHRVNLIVLDMERASREAVRLALGETPINGDSDRPG